MTKHPINLVLCWHMHQPWYQESQGGEYRLPWVYLHALKDYVDMVAHLEAHPKMRAVVNFAPILLEQLDDYDQQFRQWQMKGSGFKEPLLNLLSGHQPIPQDLEGRKALIRNCMKANRSTMIDIYPSYSYLLDQVSDKSGNEMKDTMIPYLNDQFFYDLLVWYHIIWLGHSIKFRDDVRTLIAHGHHFSADQRRSLIKLMANQFNGLIGRYRQLAEKNQIELSMSPYSHPIIPLLIDFESMRCAQPNEPMPSYDRYPGGIERAKWHIEQGISVFEHYFGMRPNGVWLSEGAVSEASLALLETYDFKWTATGEGVWGNSRRVSGFDTEAKDERNSLFHAHQLPDHPIHTFFRDDGLADMIGFEYKTWVAEDASANFISNLKNIANFLPQPLENHIVSVILDGENAWEYYPDNGFHFIGSLYERLVESDEINLITFNEATSCCPAQTLPKLCAGSWVYGSFSTWIGDVDKNRGWDRLVEAKICYDDVMATNRLSEEEINAASRQLAICEGSDWFWWFGDYNPSGSVHDFETLFRQQLKELYRLLRHPIPEKLNQPISIGAGRVENDGTMRRGVEH